MRIGSRGWVGLIIVAVGAALFAYFLGPAQRGRRVSDELSGFRVRMSSDKLSYSAVETVRVTFTVCRSRLLPARTSSGGGTDVRVRYEVADDAGNIVEDSSKQIRTSELRLVFWLPGQCRSEIIEWEPTFEDLRDQETSFGQSESGDEQALTFEMSAQWLSAVWDAPPRRIQPVQTIKVTVEPNQ